MRHASAWIGAAAMALAAGLSGSSALGDVVGETFGLRMNRVCSRPGAMTIAQVKGGWIVTVDISALGGARVYHASLVGSRQGRGLEDRQDEWLRPTLVYPLASDAEDVPENAKPLVLEAPWFAGFNVTDVVAKAAAGKDKSVRFLVKELYRWQQEPTELNVTYEGKAENLPPQVSGVRASHKGGNTFVTFDEIEKLADKPDITIGEFARLRAAVVAREKPSASAAPTSASSTPAAKTGKVRYRVLRHTAPITAANVGEAVALAEVGPLACANIDGGMDHFGRATETQNRLVVEEGKDALPWGRGLYVHTTAEKEGTFHYAVVTVVNGRANLKDIAAANAPADGLNEKSSPIPVPVLQQDVQDGKGVFGGVRAGARVRLYVTWNAEPYYNVPNAYSNWSVTIDEKQWSSVAPLGLYLHEWAGTHVRTTWGWPGGRTGILVAGNDWPPQTWWYGFHECLGTLKSWSEGKVHNYTERRVLAFLDWVENTWAVDRNRVFAQGGSMGGAGIYTFALRNGERFAAVFGNVGIANWPVRGHFTTAIETCVGYFKWDLPTTDGVPTSERLNMAKWLRDNPRVETPFIVCGNGKNDGAIGWEQAHGFFLALQETKRPHAVHWGMGGHGTPGVNMQIDEKRGQAFRLDQTLPAFAHCSLDGDIGTAKKLDAPKDYRRGNESAKDAYDGDSDGCFNAYLRWETDDARVVDQPKAWEMTLLLAKSCPSDSCTVDLTPRRCQKFQAKGGQKFKWTNTPLPAPAPPARTPTESAPTASAPTNPSSGLVTADKDGLVTIEKAVVTKAGNRIRLEPAE